MTNIDESVTNVESSNVAGSSLASEVAKVATVLSRPHYPPSDRAALKRWSAGQALPLAFYRLWLQHLRTDPPPESQALGWMALVWGLALAGDGHEPRRPLGQALAEANYAEARVERLLSAPEELRIDFYASLVRFLVARGIGFNWAELAAFLLTKDPTAREQIHRAIAYAYYRNLPRSPT